MDGDHVCAFACAMPWEDGIVSVDQKFTGTGWSDRQITLDNDGIHYNEVIVSVMPSQITILTIVYSTVYSGADQRKHQSSASLAFVRGIHRWPVNTRHKWPVTRKMFPFDDVIMSRVLAEVTDKSPSITMALLKRTWIWTPSSTRAQQWKILSFSLMLICGTYHGVQSYAANWHQAIWPSLGRTLLWGENMQTIISRNGIRAELYKMFWQGVAQKVLWEAFTKRCVSVGGRSIGSTKKTKTKMIEFSKILSVKCI